MASALMLAIVATACVLLLTGAVVLAEIGRVWVRQFVQKHEKHAHLLGPRVKGSPDA